MPLEIGLPSKYDLIMSPQKLNHFSMDTTLFDQHHDNESRRYGDECNERLLS